MIEEPQPCAEYRESEQRWPGRFLSSGTQFLFAASLRQKASATERTSNCSPCI